MATTTDDNFEDYEEVTDDISQIRWEDAPALALFTFMILIVGLQFFTRYALNDSLAWTEEAARYCLIMLTFLGSAICVRQGSHLLIGVIFRHLPRPAIKPLAMFNELAMAGFFGGLAWLGLTMIERTSRQMMITLPFPKSYAYTVITLGCGLAMLYGIVNLLRIARRTPEDIASRAIGGI
ncbi:TRAP transporter small permease [Paracoccus homiensis]|uniref:TRAP transporter small permease protein n=1 Tax=Paracoccus homiensis TaxID=364199 RepID=A0A1I0HEQ3_9RHOB|nr:TRAP transporter small permease [Paracoccus homiensis]SET82178.1 TRAP-type C4-dicarboxylate transport system, small permease component [Paracoccus homiensis]